MRTIEVTIIDRASVLGLRPSSSEASTRSGPEVCVEKTCPEVAGTARAAIAGGMALG